MVFYSFDVTFLNRKKIYTKIKYKLIYQFKCILKIPTFLDRKYTISANCLMNKMDNYDFSFIKTTIIVLFYIPIKILSTENCIACLPFGTLKATFYNGL